MFKVVGLFTATSITTGDFLFVNKKVRRVGANCELIHHYLVSIDCIIKKINKLKMWNCLNVGKSNNNPTVCLKNILTRLGIK
jgi:hypothetical protein